MSLVAWLITVITAAMVSGLIEYLLGHILPDKPNLKHVLAIFAFICVLAVFSFWASSKETVNQDLINANQVSNCVEKHDLAEAHEKRTNRENTNFLFLYCDWPPPVFADPDGFTLIEVNTVDGPEANRTDIGLADVVAPLADRIKSSCNTLQIEYNFGRQGEFGYLEPIEVRSGTIVDAWGNHEVLNNEGYDLTQLARFDMAPEKNEVIVLRTYGWSIENVQCLD